MGLLDDLTKLNTARKPGGGVRCRIATVLETMTEDEREALSSLIDDSDVYGTMIARTLQAHGHQVNASQLGHHRRRLRGAGCSCPLPNEAA